MRLNTVGWIVTLAIGILSAPLVAVAQTPAQVPRIGYFWPSHPLSKTSPRGIPARAA